MSILFSPVTVGSLTLRNRLMRSATAERLADPNTGAPLPKLAQLYRELAEGGIGLIVTGHLYVDRHGKAHPEMAALDDDALIPRWRETIAPAQAAGAKVMVQINYGGASCDPAMTPDSLSPSGVPTNESNPNPGVMTNDDVQALILAFGQAARSRRGRFRRRPDSSHARLHHKPVPDAIHKPAHRSLGRLAETTDLLAGALYRGAGIKLAMTIRSGSSWVWPAGRPIDFRLRTALWPRFPVSRLVSIPSS